MTSILFEIERIRRLRFKFQYLKNQNIFLIFLIHFWNQHQISKILKKKYHRHSYFITEFTGCEKLDKITL